ncbi:MAG: GNAT family N-acetyltransferase, partial [Pseudomonadota bacterium]
MQIREATAADLPEITALLADDGLGRNREEPGDPVYAAAFARMQAQPGNVVLVATGPDGAILGCLQITIIHGLSRRGMTRAQIEGVRVAASACGAGLGRQLMEAAIARARMAGCGLVQLTSDKRREDAHRFYTSLGFEATHEGLK